MLSLASNPDCLLMDDELNILPTSSHVASIVPIPLNEAGLPDVPGAGAPAAELADLVESLKETQVRCAGSTRSTAVALMALADIAAREAWRDLANKYIECFRGMQVVVACGPFWCLCDLGCVALCSLHKGACRRLVGPFISQRRVKKSVLCCCPGWLRLGSPVRWKTSADSPTAAGHPLRLLSLLPACADAASGGPGCQVKEPGPGARGRDLPGRGFREDAALHRRAHRRQARTLYPNPTSTVWVFLLPWAPVASGLQYSLL